MHHPAARRRRTRSRVAATAVLVLLLSTLAAAAGAQERLTAQELGLRTTVGFGGEVHGGGWLPVEVRLAPTRLFGGTVTVLSQHNGGRLAERIPVEVAAGSEKVYRFVVPQVHHLQVEVAEDGRDPLTAAVDLPHRRGTSFLVGVLGAPVPQQAPLVSSIASELTPSYASIDPAWLALTGRVLDGVGAVVADETVIDELGDEARAALTAAVASGLELLVTVDHPGPIDLGLPWSAATQADNSQLLLEGGPAAEVRSLTPSPGAWTLRGSDLRSPDADGEAASEAADPVLAAAVTAGRGRVTLVGAGLGASGLGQLWSQVLQPGSHLLEVLDGASSWRPMSVANETVRSQGLSLPSLPWLGAFLLAYVLLVGPLNGFVLSRIRRRELAWLTIPAITVVFATGAYAGASGAQPPVGLTASAGVWVDGAGTEIAVTAVRSPREGVHTTRFVGDGWSVLPATETAAPARLDRTGGDTSVSLDLGSLQVGTLIGWRTTSVAAPLELTAVAEGDAGLLVTVTNRGAVPVNDIVVHAATATRRVGSLAAGDASEIRFEGLEELPTREPWQDEFAGLRRNNGQTVAPRSLEALLRWGVLDDNPGTIFAVGVTEASLLPLPAPEGGAEDLGSVVAVGVTPTVDASAGVLTPAVVQRAFVPTSGHEFGRPNSLAIEGPGRALLRYRLPEGVEPSALLSSLDRSWGQRPGDFEGPGGGGRGGCFTEPVFDEEGNLIGEQEICEDVVEVRPLPAPGMPVAEPVCPPDAECSLDGQLFEICRQLPEGVRECHVEIVGPAGQPPIGEPPIDVGGAFSLEVYDHGDRSWRFLGDALTAGDRSLDPARFLGPLGEVFVRASGELFPFDFSGRGLGATLGGAA